MTRYLASLLIITCILSGCGSRGRLELRITVNNDTLEELVYFGLTSITKGSKPLNFSNPKDHLGKFQFESLKPDIYIGLLTIRHNNVGFNVTIDSIVVNKNTTDITRNFNLGSTHLER